LPKYVEQGEAQAGPSVEEQAARPTQEEVRLRPQPTPYSDQLPRGLSDERRKLGPKRTPAAEKAGKNLPDGTAKPATSATHRGDTDLTHDTCGSRWETGFKRRLQGRQGQILIGAHVLGQQRVGHAAVWAANPPEGAEKAIEATAVRAVPTQSET
jgi:hypothetical protein